MSIVLAWLARNPAVMWGLAGAGALLALVVSFSLWKSGFERAVRADQDVVWKAEIARMRSVEQKRQDEIREANYARGLADGIVRAAARDADREKEPEIVREIVERSAAAAACRHDGVSAAALGRLRGAAD